MKKRFVAKKSTKIKVKFLLFFIASVISFYYIFNLIINIKVIGPILKSDSILKIGLSNTSIKYRTISPKELFYLGTEVLLGDIPKIDTNLSAIDSTSNDEKPLVYIYNTHDTESYTSHILEAYNISFTVKTASFILRDYLKEYGIASYVERDSMGDYLRNNGLKYKDSYKASRYYLTKRMEEFPSIKLFIDLHRDSARKNATSIEIDGKKYAKVLFVVGLDYQNPEHNIRLAEEFNNKIDTRLTRGISRKTGSKVNGVYNQDILENSILLEVGGQDNTIEEVNNTLKEISQIIFKYMEGV